MKLTDKQRERYSRQLVLDAVGEDGQQKISDASVLVIGTGGLGSPVLLYLAAAGVGTLGVADGDVVDHSNLQRQIIHSTSDVGRPKVDSAAEKLSRLNPDVRLIKHPLMAAPENITQMIDGYDFVVEATDNFETKFLINDACVLAGKPFSHAGVLRMSGQTITVLPGRSACLRCLFDQPPPPGSVPGAAQVGILGAVAGTLGTVQATEALKYILGAGVLLQNRLMKLDAQQMRFTTLNIKRNSACKVCGTTAFKSQCQSSNAK
ncbi:MAG: HesA/MoeB/ThiF family protein [Desulfobacteraceae bacterium]|jgi:adenylyltransferase/sulfurtransferase